MVQRNAFDVQGFLPYLLNQAADASSRGFQSYYKSTYGMLRTEWRVVFHLGRYGPMTAKEICKRASIHKTKVSRAVRALEVKRYLTRKQLDNDKRHERLALTKKGASVFQDLLEEAQRYDAKLMAAFSDDEAAQIKSFLAKIAAL